MVKPSHYSDHVVDAGNGVPPPVGPRPLTCTGPVEDCRWLQPMITGEPGGSKRGGGGIQ
jgi:hypothetical protein